MRFMYDDLSFWADRIQEILDRSNLSFDEKDEILDIFKHVGYMWCEENAAFCFMEDTIRQLVSKESFNAITRHFILNNHPYVDEKMRETFPWYDDDDDDVDDLPDGDLEDQFQQLLEEGDELDGKL